MPLVASASGGYLAALLQMLVALAGVSALAVLVLRWAARRGLGRAPSGRRMELIERLPLDQGAYLNLVRVDDREMVVGSAPGRAPRPVADLTDPHRTRTTFRRAFAEASSNPSDAPATDRAASPVDASADPTAP